MKASMNCRHCRVLEAGLIAAAVVTLAGLSGCGCGRSVKTEPSPPAAQGQADKGAAPAAGTAVSPTPQRGAGVASAPAGAGKAAAPVETAAAKAAREQFLQKYPVPEKVKLLEAQQKNGAWTIRVRTPHGPLIMSQAYQHAYGEHGYKVVQAKASVIKDRTHSVLVMRKGDSVLDMRTAQDDADPNITIVTLKGGTSVPLEE